MEDAASFVSSRGLLKSCDFRNLQPVSSSNHVDTDLFHGPPFGATVYVCTDALAQFSNTHLSHIKRPFVLVSGDSDAPVDGTLIESDPVRDILKHPLLTDWYAQNKLIDHPKLHHLPIGMDYHTMWERPGFWGLSPQSALAQERALLQVLAASRHFTDRLYGGYCNWHFSIDRGDRRECMEKIDKSFCLIEQHPISRISSWQRQAECMFVVSPEGAGVDCHRTWEALLLGCVPVVKKSQLTPLFAQLPVVVLDDWSEFNSTHMLEHVSRLRSEKFDFSSLFLRFWTERIRGGTRFSLPMMSLLEFRDYLCRESF